MAGDKKSDSKGKNNVRSYKDCKFYKENYGRYMSWGMFLPMNRLHRPMYYLWIGGHLPVIFYSSYLLFEEEFAVFTEVIHFGILLVLSLVGTVFFNPEHLEKLIWYYEEGFDVYGGTIDNASGKKIKKVNLKMLKRKNLHSAFMYYGLYGAASSICILRPLYEWISGKYQNISYKDNVNRMLPLSVWYPLDVSTWPVHIYMLCVEFYVIAQTTFLVIGSTIIYISVSEELCAQISILKLTMKNIGRRAKYFGNGTATKEGVRECLKRSIIHHCRIIKLFETFQEFYSRTLWFILTITTYMICLCAFITTMVLLLFVVSKIMEVFNTIKEVYFILIFMSN